jgi:hypothetical protein
VVDTPKAICDLRFGYAQILPRRAESQSGPTALNCRSASELLVGRNADLERKGCHEPFLTKLIT